MQFWVDVFLIDKLAESMKKDVKESGDRIVRLLKGLADLCVCKGVPQKDIQGTMQLPRCVNS